VCYITQEHRNGWRDLPVHKLIERIKYSEFFHLFNFHEEQAVGRTSMLLSAVLTASINFLTTGVFYTSFLIVNGINLVNIGIISFIPLIANCFSIFSPLILERFEKRKQILAISRILYYAINILGITLLPVFVTDSHTKSICFAAIVFLANLVNALFSGGYAIWHLNFIPDTVRAHYFSSQQVISTTISSVVLLLSSFIADALKDTPNQTLILYILRFVAFAIALADVLVLLLPTEYPYLKKVKSISIKNVFILPFSNKKFLLTMLVMAMWSFSSNLTSSSLNYYLLKDCGVSYSFINIINAGYAVFLIVFSSFWRHMMGKWMWMKTFAITAMLHMPTTLLFSFTNASNFIWILLIVRLTQHFLGVGINLAYANMPYINMPCEDRTNYIVFFTLITNLSAFCGMMLSTYFIAKTESVSFVFIVFPFTSVQVLMVLQAIGQLLTGFYVIKNLKKLSPE
jgi:hypothetical protein